MKPAAATGAQPGDRRDARPLRQVLAAAGILADKRLGQHFLLDLNICRKIVRLAGVEPDDEVLEVGPGPGGLTRALLEAGARVVAVEKDARFIPVLEGLAAETAPRLTVLQADALEVEENAVLATPDRARVVANLPYNVGTPLLLKWLMGSFRPKSMTLMFQKEVAHRIVAKPGLPDYGRLSVISGALCDARCVMDLPARAFTPPPKVDSAVIHLTLLDTPPSALCIKALEEITRAAFGQRRKMLRSSLSKLGGERLCAQAGVDPSLRAEAISVPDFLRLAEARLTPAAEGHPSVA